MPPNAAHKLRQTRKGQAMKRWGRTVVELGGGAKQGANETTVWLHAGELSSQDQSAFGRVRCGLHQLTCAPCSHSRFHSLSWIALNFPLVKYKYLLGMFE